MRLTFARAPNGNQLNEGQNSMFDPDLWLRLTWLMWDVQNAVYYGWSAVLQIANCYADPAWLEAMKWCPNR